jgi:hypothetical protein
MAARQIFPESRWMPVCIAIVLMLVMVTVLLAAGCTSQHQPSGTVPSPTVFTSTQVATTVPAVTIATVCPTSADGSYRIIINPINDVKRGITPFMINGTTNLAADPSGIVRLKIVSYPTKLDPRRQWGEHSVEDYGSVFTAILDIQMGDRCINTFSTEYPGLDAQPGEYFVTVSKYGSS